MTKEDRREAIRIINLCLEDGYVDFNDILDKNELEVIKEAMDLLAVIDKWNDIGCTSFYCMSEKEKPIKIEFKGDIQTEINDNDIKITKNLSTMEAEKLLKDAFGTTDLGVLDCSGMTDKEFEKMVAKYENK